MSYEDRHLEILSKKKDVVRDFKRDNTMVRARDLSQIFVGLSQSTYDCWARDGLISRYKIKGSVFYKLSEIKELIENSKEVL